MRPEALLLLATTLADGLVLPRYHMLPAAERRAVSSTHRPHIPEAALHQIANRAIKRGLHEDALVCYDRAIVAPPVDYSGRSFLLLALHLQRMCEFELARLAFSEGIAQFRTDAKLMQAWGLFESKQGNLDRAKRLLQRAVALDPSLAAVLRWKIFREAQPVTPHTLADGCHVLPHSRRHSPVQASALAMNTAWVHVATPVIRYTVPSQNIGWRGLAARGEDTTKWYDGEGVRNGPPSNFWRQAADERFYYANLAAVTALRDGGAVEAALAPLEQRMPLQKPHLNRKLLGCWAPLMRAGRPAIEEGCDGAAVGVRATLEVRRAGDDRTTENRYGEFDAHLEAGEELRFSFAPADGASAEATLCASDENERRELPFEVDGEQLALGRLSFLSEYLLVSRDESGAADVWMRVGGTEPWSAPSLGPLARSE